MFTTLNSKLKRMLSVVLALSMVLSPIMTFAEEVGGAVATAFEKPIAVVYAGSDFQPRVVTGEYDDKGEPTGGSNLNAGISQMGAIVDQIHNDYGNLVTGALFCGDYSLYSKYKSNTEYANAVRITEDGIAIVESILGSKFGLSREEIVMIQGNHDFYISPLDFTGAHDTLNYGVYAINEKDFMYQQGTLANGEDTVKKTASGLEAYLKAKINQQYNKPIFIVNHIPLHHGARSEDNRYAKHLFDVINKYGGQGLTIIYLFGHNHSKGYDAHIGEGAIYLKPGEVMCVPNGTTTVRDGKTVYGYDKETLNFAYMNAGYTGHFTVNPDGHTDDTLTSTAFVIYEDRVEIKRYDEDGLHQLKAPGKYLAAYEAHDLHIYTHAIDENGDVIRLDNKFNVSLNIDRLYPESEVDSTVVTGVTVKSGEFQKEAANAVTKKDTGSKTLTLPVAKNFKANSEGIIGIDYVSEEFYIDSVLSSDTGVATVTLQADGNILVKGVKAGVTTLTVVAKHREGAYADVVLTYDLVVCPGPDAVTNLGYTRYKLTNATQINQFNDKASSDIYATIDANMQVGESYIFVSDYQSSDSAWAYAMLNSESSPASRSRNVAIYGSPLTDTGTRDKKTYTYYYNTLIDSCDEYMEWVYCKGGYLRNAATGLFLGNNVGSTEENKDVTLRNFSLSNVCPRDFDKNGNTDNDFNTWKWGSFGTYIDDESDQNVSSTTYDDNLGYRRYLRYDSSTKTFKAEMITDYTDNTNGIGRGQQYSNVFVYKKVVKESSDDVTAWVDTTDIYAIKGDLTGKTNATLYISDGMNVTAVPVTVNMLVSATEYVDSTTTGTVATDFTVRYDDIDVATGVTLTLVDGITKKTDTNKTIKVGDNTTVTFNVTAEDATVSYSYESLDKRYVTVAQDGTVTGVNVGGASVRITALVKYGDSAPIAVTDDVYVTVNPSDTCFNNVRKFGDNLVYVLTDSLKSDTHNKVKDGITYTYQKTEPFMIVSTNAPGEAFAMQSDWGRNNNFVPAPVTVESYNGKYFISDLNDASLVWELTQDSNFYYGGTLYKNGASSDKSGNHLPTKAYYQLDNTKYVGLDFLIALDKLEHAGYAATLLDYGTGLFASIGKAALPEDAIEIAFPAISYRDPDTKIISETEPYYKNYAAAWNYSQSELGFAAINYVPSNLGSHFDTTSSSSGHFTYILTFDRDIENFKSVYHANKWPGELNKEYADKYYEGRVFAYTKQTIQTPGVTIWVSSKNGTVGLNATHDTPTGAMLNITTHSPEGVSTVSYPITYGMLEKEGMKTDTKQTYTNVNIPYTYNGTEYNICGSFTLNVADTTKDYPTFPDQGSVNTTKTLDTSKYPYSSTGVSHIDLTVSGVPVSNGADVVIMLDASTSMQEKVGGSNGEPRLKMLYRSLVELMETLKTPDENGKYADVDVSIASFNGQTYIDSNYLISPLDNLMNCTSCHADAIYYYYNHADKSTVNLPFADVTDPSYDAFIESLQYDLVHAYFGKDNDKTGEKCNVKTIIPSSGTNYDRAMELTYDLLKEKQEVNAARGENRKQYVIFMSDGESWQFNYFGGRNANSDQHETTTPNNGYAFHDKYGLAKWMYVLSGTVMENDAAITDFTKTRWNTNSGDTTPFIGADQQEIFKKYYNPDGKHWMAEAIKAPKTALCKIIDPDSTNADKIEEVYGLGATMYTMAFAIGSDPGKGLDEELIEDVVRLMATSDAHFTNITNSSDTYEELKEAMLKIKSDVKSAGDAMYVDQMGDDFDLQMKKDYKVGEKTYHLDPAPTITLTSYPLYKYWEVGSVVEGVLVTEDMVGKRKLSRTGTEIEKIWFDGGGAYSSLIKEDDININILSDYIIKGKNIWYNTGDTVYTLTDADKLNVPAFEVRGITELQPETFYWVVGEVPEDEYVLGYDVYLEGSMEGTALAGQHDTNNFAKLTYKNHLDNICEKSVPSPKLPWDKAYVGVGFYFVNEYGQPLVNRYGGQTGSFEKALKLDGIYYYEFPLNASGSVQASKEIIAKDVLPDGYMLYDKDAAYKVFATSSNELVPNWTITKDPNLQYASTYVTQFSSTVTSSNKLEESDASYSYTNTIIYFAIYGSVTAASDTVVVDYGLPVNINLLQNDVLFDNQATLAALGVDPKTAPEFKEELDKKRGELLSGFKNNSEIQETYNGKFGTAEILTSEETVGTVKYPVGTSIRYTLNTANSMEFNEKETFSYAADYQGDIGIQGYYYANVNIIPATIVYYEEDFAEFKVYDLDEKDYTNNANADPTGGDNHSYWIPAITNNKLPACGVQGEDRPGHLTQNDMNNLYGYDTAYSDSVEASLRTLKKITLKPKTNNPDANDLGQYEAEVSFTFYGTGFDVISASSKGTAPILVKVYKVNEGEIKLGSNGFPEGKPVISKFVDTYYGYTYNETTGEWEVTTGGPNALYQIPVIKCKDLEYGRYKVYITTSYNEKSDHRNAGSYTFYFDGIRIYDPVNNGVLNGEADNVIQDAYIKDNEAWPIFKEVRNLLIDADSFDALTHDNFTTGVVFIDGARTNTSISDYTNYGPNNEVYLTGQQAIAFDLRGNNASGVHIAMKCTRTYTVDAVIYSITKDSNGKVNIKDTITINGINTATDFYYDISKFKDSIVVVKNNSEASSDPAAKNPNILSITNLKFTYESKEKHDLDLDQPLVKMSKEAGNTVVTAMRMVNTPWLEPDVEIPNVFVPEQFDVLVSKTEVRQGSTVTVTVNTSADVDHITVNGVEVTRYTKSWFTSERQWKYTVRASEAGEMPIEVVAYNSDGDASDAVENTVTVTKRLSLGSNSSGGLFDRIYGGWFGSIFAKAN